MLIYFAGTTVCVSRGCSAVTVHGAGGNLSVPDGEYLGCRTQVINKDTCPWGGVKEWCHSLRSVPWRTQVAAAPVRPSILLQYWDLVQMKTSEAENEEHASGPEGPRHTPHVRGAAFTLSVHDEWCAGGSVEELVQPREEEKEDRRAEGCWRREAGGEEGRTNNTLGILQASNNGGQIGRGLENEEERCGLHPTAELRELRVGARAPPGSAARLCGRRGRGLR